MQTFSQTIVEARTKNNLGLRELAKRVGISAGYLSEIERELKPAPSDTIVQSLADTLSLDYKELLKLAAADRLHYSKVKIITKLFANKELGAEFINELDTIAKKDMKELTLQLICTIRVYKQDKMRETLWNEEHTK